MWRRRKRTAGEYMALFLLGGLLYGGLEIIWRGYTHPVMAVIGGIGFLLVGGIGRRLPADCSLVEQGLLGGTAITALELLSGLALNRYLGLRLWDYSDLPLNVMGQICAPFWALWCLLSVAGVIVNDFLRCRLSRGEQTRRGPVPGKKTNANNTNKLKPDT